MAAYHKYVFDSEERRFVGNFEEMYRAEDTAGFDSWFERDLRLLRKTISLEILSAYNFNRIFEFGCGKGTFTHLLKKENNTIVALDVSETAVAKAKHSFPDIDFRPGDVADVAKIADAGEQFDLGLVMCTLAYVESWRELIEIASRMCRWIYVAEFIPSNPIGYVKSPEELIAEVEKHFAIRTKVLLNDEHCLLLAEGRIGR